MILALIVGTLVGRFVAPFAFWMYGIEFTRFVRHRLVSAGFPGIAAYASTAAIYLPDWVCAVLLGGVIGRVVRRHTLLTAWACAIGFTLLAGCWGHAELDFFWFRSQRMNWKFFLLLLQWQIVTLIVLVGVAWVVYRRRRRVAVAGFPVQPVGDPSGEGSATTDPRRRDDTSYS